MANRKATFAKRQRETDLKDRAKAKDARRLQKRNEVPGTKGPQIAWEETVRQVSSDELPSLTMGNEGRSNRPDSPPRQDAAPGDRDPGDADAAAPATSPDPAAAPAAAPTTPPRGG
jgi:hypothetical protein